MSWFTNIIGGGLVKSLENIASEWIETDMETAEAKALMIKTLDPNGKMRRDLSRFACWAYGFYLASMVVLAFMTAFGIGGETCNGEPVVCVLNAKTAAEMLVDLFLPITGAWTAIVSASFGVNATNVIKGR